MRDHEESARPRSILERWPAAVLLVVFVCGVIALVLVTRPKLTPLERLQRELREAVPIGAKQAEVAAWARRVGGTFRLSSYDPALLPPEPEKTFPELAGLSRAELASFIEVRLAWGEYRVWHDGTRAKNELCVLMPLDPDGRVLGYHFLTLEELATIERKRLEK
jgi:hypothetical protein